MILKAYERETMADIKNLWRLNVVISALNNSEIKGYDDWLEGIREHTNEQENIDSVELLERIKKDLGKA